MRQRARTTLLPPAAINAGAHSASNGGMAKVCNSLERTRRWGDRLTAKVLASVGAATVLGSDAGTCVPVRSQTVRLRDFRSGIVGLPRDKRLAKAVDAVGRTGRATNAAAVWKSQHMSDVYVLERTYCQSCVRGNRRCRPFLKDEVFGEKNNLLDGTAML